MKRTTTLVLLVASVLTASLAATVAPTPAHAELIDRIVARIDDQIVTYYQLEQAATPFMLQNGINPSVLDDPQRRREVYQQVLDDLVERKLLLQEARKLDLSVSDKQVDQWLAYTRKKQEMSEQQFRQMVSRYGMSFKAYREMIRQNLLKIRLVKVKVGSQVSVSDDKVEQAYQQRFGDQSAKTKHITVSHILIRPKTDTPAAIEAARAKATKAREAIENGTEFAEAANTYSEGPSKAQGGKLGTFTRGELNPDFEDVAFQLAPGQVSQVVHTDIGFHVIKVSDVSYTSDDNAQQRKSKLRAQLQQKAVERQLQAYVQKLRAQSFIKVSF